MLVCFFFFNDTATTEIYTLSLHDALPIYVVDGSGNALIGCKDAVHAGAEFRHDVWQEVLWKGARRLRSEEHTSELQSRQYLVCRLLLEKKKKLIYFSQVTRALTTI